MNVRGMGWTQFVMPWLEKQGSKCRRKSIKDLESYLNNIIKAERKLKTKSEPDKYTVSEMARLASFWSGCKAESREFGQGHHL